MNDEKPKSIWKKPLKPPVNLLLWFILLLALFVVGLAIVALGTANVELPYSYGWLIALGFSLLAVLLIAFVRWLCHWRNFKRFLFGLACLATLVALFYAEEDWRGKHDWDQFKRQSEAKGEKFAFTDFVPPPVPDDQNFAFSPVWIAEERCLFQTELKRAEAWYGNRIYSKEVSRILPLLPVSQSGLVGTNWCSQSHLPNVPEGSGTWAAARTVDLKPWQVYYRDLEKTYPAAEISIAPQPQSPAKDVLLALSKFNPVIEQLRQDSARPDSRFPIGYDDEDKAAILLPHLAILKRYSQMLQLRAIAELQNGQIDEALADVKLMLRLADSIRTEPFLISHLVRIAMLQITLQPIYEGLADHKWSNSQLAELDLELAKLDFLSDYELSMRGERSCEIGVIEFIRHRSLRRFDEQIDLSGNGDRTQLSVGAILYYLCPYGWFYQNEMQICRFYAKWYLPLVNEAERTVSPGAVQAVDQAHERELRHRTPENFLLPWLLPSLGRAVEKFAYAQESTDLARVAIALERYRLVHGQYPESLDAIAPQFIAQLPHDIINGQPLHYRRTTDGQFALYSVGWNERDDGGSVGYREKSSPRDESRFRVDISKGDWVWRYPSK